MTQTVVIVAILDELKSIDSAVPFAKTVTDGRLELPQWISAGDGVSLIINRKIGSLIRELADMLYDSQPGMMKSISRQDWSGVVQRVIGPLLGKTDLDSPVDASAKTILANLQHELETTEWNYKKRTFLFGCSFIGHHQIQPFTIGPVTVWEPREMARSCSDQWPSFQNIPSKAGRPLDRQTSKKTKAFTR